MTLCILTACVNTKSESSANNDGQISFQNGDLMTDVSEDSLGNPLTYPMVRPLSQVKLKFGNLALPRHGIIILIQE
jgi:hypothetical protein